MHILLEILRGSFKYSIVSWEVCFEFVHVPVLVDVFLGVGQAVFESFFKDSSVPREFLSVDVRIGISKPGVPTHIYI